MNNEMFPLLVGTILIGLLVIFIISFVVQYRKAQLKFQIEKQRMQQALLETEMEIRENTLADLSRDLHDNFGQIASLIKINLNMLPPPEQPEARERIAESKKLLKQLIEDMRALSHSLNPENLKKRGLVNLVEADVARVNRAGMIHIDLQTEPLIKDLSAETTVVLYRVFQELINNLLKHSGATEAQVIISQEPGLFRMSVSDNGKGFDADAQTDGSGLSNLKHRCHLIGAQSEIKSYPGKGTFTDIAIST